MLYLIPTYLGENSPRSIFSPELIGIVENLQHFIVENEKSARKFIRFIYPEVDQAQLQFELIDKRFSEADIPEVTRALQEGKNVGLLSEAGTPCIADPGNIVVSWAHRNGVQVKPLVGPSSLYLALMASGLNGQHFEFHGYLPIDKNERKKTIQNLEQESRKWNKTQIFMETPYRNNAFFSDLLANLQSNTMICVATEITLPQEKIQTMLVSDWKNVKFDINQKPTIYLLHSN